MKGHRASIEVEIFEEGRRRRYRPVRGQEYPPTMRVQWRRDLRELYPAGTRIRLWLLEAASPGKRSYLSAPNDADYRITWTPNS
jgi:hypothetical protein